jgi:hypothetical protein
MPESPRSRAGTYVFIVVGILIVAGAGYYVLKGVFAPHSDSPAATTSEK